MNRQQFAEAVKKLDTSPYKIIINASSDGAWRRGCFLEDGIWKVYETDGRGRLHILFQNKAEEKAFAYLYQLLCTSAQKKRKSWFQFWK